MKHGDPIVRERQRCIRQSTTAELVWALRRLSIRMPLRATGCVRPMMQLPDAATIPLYSLTAISDGASRPSRRPMPINADRC